MIESLCPSRCRCIGHPVGGAWILLQTEVGACGGGLFPELTFSTARLRTKGGLPECRVPPLAKDRYILFEKVTLAIISSNVYKQEDDLIRETISYHYDKAEESLDWLFTRYV